MSLITFTHQIALSLHRVGLAGAAVNLSAFHKLGKQWQQDAARIHDRLTKFALRHGMKQFRPTNDEDIRSVIYKKLGYPIIAKTAKGGLPAVDKPTLLRLLKEHKKSPFISDLIEYNTKDKLASTWYGTGNTKTNRRKSVGELIVPVSRAEAARSNRANIGLLHFWIFPLRARTGRRASGGGEEGDPESRNSQNWPSIARRVVVSRWKRGKIAICDFTRLEVVLMGWRACDEKLLDYFLNGNGYIGVAKEFWGQDVADGTPLYKATKSFVLGLNYNMGPWKLANDLWYRADFKFSEDWDEHCRQTRKARKRYLRMFDGLRRYIKDRIREVTETQQVVSPSGRIRHLPHHGPESEGFWHIKNAAVNQPIQSFASEVTGSAIVDYESELLHEHGLSYNDWHLALLERPWDLPCSPVFNEVHDELDLDLHPKTGKKDLAILVECMRRVRSLKKLVPEFDLTLKVDVKVKDTWDENWK